MRKIVSIIHFMLFLFQASAQEVIFERDVKKQIERTYNDSAGPNGAVFSHQYYNYGIILPANENDSAAIRDNMQSNYWSYGVRTKFKLNETFALGFDVFYMHQRYRIQQSDSINIFSLGYRNDVQKLKFNTLGLGLYLRINFGKRGNVLGKYLDMGADMNYVFSERLFAKNEVDIAGNGASDEVVRTIYKKLDYTSNLQGFATVRFGVNYFAFIARYRFTDMFVRSDEFYPIGKIPELPRISVGVEIVLPTE